MVELAEEGRHPRDEEERARGHGDEGEAGVVRLPAPPGEEEEGQCGGDREVDRPVVGEQEAAGDQGQAEEAQRRR